MGFLISRTKNNLPKLNRKYWTEIGRKIYLVKVVELKNNKYRLRQIISDPILGDNIYKAGRLLPRLRKYNELYNIHTL